MLEWPDPYWLDVLGWGRAIGTMGGIFSRIGSDPYYASYEKSLSRAQTDIERLKVGAPPRAGGGGVLLDLSLP